MNKLLPLFFAAVLLCFACGGKKKKMSGGEKVDLKDFIEFFDKTELPFVITDSVLKAPVSDSALISDTIFRNFIPDTIFRSVYGEKTPAIYQMGRFKNDKAETYLLLKTKAKINAVYVLALSPENQYKSNLLLMSDGKKNNVDLVTIDDSYTFTLLDQYKDAGGNQSQFSQVYAFTDMDSFMVILEDGLQKGELTEIINPIDTFPLLNKLSGNYGKDDRNFITIRDGRTPNELLFYIHMDKGAKTDCQAELKGEATIIGKDSALYNSKSDPCAIMFRFTSKAVTITEQTVCGNKRPADCSFNATYDKIIPPSEKKGKKKK